jgi:hypothetical protein
MPPQLRICLADSTRRQSTLACWWLLAIVGLNLSGCGSRSELSFVLAARDDGGSMSAADASLDREVGLIKPDASFDAEEPPSRDAPDTGAWDVSEELPSDAASDVSEELPSDAASDVPLDVASEPADDAFPDVVAPQDASTDVVSDAVLDRIDDVTTDPIGDTAIERTPDSSHWDWPRTWGGTGRETAKAVAVANDGSVVVIGDFEGTVDFDPGPDVDERAAQGTDVFVTKFAADGTYLWTRTWGGPVDPAYGGAWDDSAEGVATTSDGSILVVGYFCTTVDFDPGPGVDTRTPARCFDAFLTKLNPDGSYAFTRTWGAEGRDRANGVREAADGSIFVGGQFENTVDFDPGSGNDDHASAGEIDLFLVKLDANGAFRWARTWGGPATEYNAGRLGVDDTGAVVVTGSFEDTADFDSGPGVDPRTATGGDDIFVIKFLPDGTRDWARTFGGDSGELAADIATTHQGSVAVTGLFYGKANFDPTGGTDEHVPGGLYDTFVTRLNADGSYAWTRTFTSSSGSIGTSWSAVSFDADDNVIVGGSWAGTADFDPGPGTFLRTSNDYDIFAVQLRKDGGFGWARTWTGPGGQEILGLQTTADGYVVAVGEFMQTIDLSVRALPDPRTSKGSYDAFALKWVNAAP